MLQRKTGMIKTANENRERRNIFFMNLYFVNIELQLAEGQQISLFIYEKFW